MIEVDRLVMYKINNEYKFAIINKENTKVTIVVDNAIVDFNEKKVFTFKYIAGNDIDDEYEITSESFRDFLHIALCNNRKSIVSPAPSILPNYKKFAKLEELIPCRGIKLDRKDLAKIEKYLNKTVFKKIVEEEKRKQEKENSLEYVNF